jgi:hypothetical protein
MGRPYQFKIIDRRQTVYHFLRLGLSPREIARKLKCRIEIIERDLKAIEADRDTWDEAHELGMEYEALKFELEQERKEKEAELRRLQRMKAQMQKAVEDGDKLLEKARKGRTQPTSRGLRRPTKQIDLRRGIVLELRDRGIKQKKIARMLNIPVRTLQGDYAVFRNRDYESLMAREIDRRERLSVYTNEELVEFLTGSKEWIKELGERPGDPTVRFKLKWVKVKRRGGGSKIQ